MTGRGPDEERILRAIDDHVDAAIADVRAAMRQPSVSQSGEGIAAMAALTQDYLHSLGAEARQFPGQRAPIVEGTLGSDLSKPTLLLYDLYDVQPAAGQAGWTVDPFAAEIVVAAGGERRLVGRGAFNSKGPLFGTLAVLKAFREEGIALPVNLRFLIEGEEEIGSPSLHGYIEANRAALSACDGAFIPYFSTTSDGETILRLGFKGLVLLRFAVTAGDWGGPAKGDIHALHGALVASPAWQLVRALSTLVDADERLTVDGLDAAGNWSPDSDGFIRRAAATYDPDAHRAALGVRRFKHGASAERLLGELMGGATLNLHAIEAGKVEAGIDPATIIPREANAFADLRLVPGMDPQEVVSLIRRHLDRRGFGHVAVEMRSGYPASVCSPRDPLVAAMIDGCAAHAERLQVYPIHAGAAPMYVFSEDLGLPYAFGGVGRGGGSHGPDEYIVLDDMVLFMRSIASFLFRFAERHEGAPC